MARLSRRAPKTVATADALGEVWRGLRRGQVFPLNPLTGLLGFLGSRDHLVPDSGLRRLVARHVERERLEDMPLPLHIVTVDVMTGEELRLSAGSAIDAVMASAAIPAVLPPVRWEDRELMDGGVANNTPISHAVELGGHEIYVLPTGHACALEQPPRSALAMALHALTLLMHRRLIDDIEKTQAPGQPRRPPAALPAGRPTDRLRPSRRPHPTGPCPRLRVPRQRRRSAPADPHAHAPPPRHDCG
jgi:NTE family protein